jgi:pyruvate carboxylase subunit B
LATRSRSKSKTTKPKSRGARRADSARAAAKPVGIMDTTLRDGHQCLLATRMRTEDMLPILETLDNAGFAALEVWGGATFDATHRFLNEDPWERLATFKRLTKTPLQMLLRGQNLVGYRHYADDVVRAFCAKSAETGIDVFRVFDALNDERNMETCFDAIHKAGKHIQGTVCYTITERRLGGPIYTVDYFVKKAKTLESMGAHSICLKDMAGLLAPLDAYEVIRAIKAAVKLPLQLHTHYTSGFASMTVLKAVEAGVDIVDCALAPLALRTGQPAVEPILVALQGSERDPGIALEPLIAAAEHLERIAPKYADYLDTSRMATIDTEVLIHQIPGGMMSNLVSQLKEAGAMDRLKEVQQELPRTRADLGYPPLVTPSSQIVGTQAVMNVLFGRYERITQPVKDYAAGLYGRPPAPMDPAVVKKCLVGHKMSKSTTKRPADFLEPEMEKAAKDVAHITTDPKDILTYAMYPTTGLRFLKWKHGLEEPPTEVRPKTLEQAKREAELSAKARKGLLVEPPSKEAPERSGALRSFNVFVDGEYFQVEVDPQDGPPRVVGAPAPTPTPAAGPRPPAKPAVAAPPRKPTAPPVAAAAGPGAIVAPMPGLIVEYKVKVGDTVKASDVVLILEAMKMQNEITAERDGKVASIGSAAGSQVAKGDVLLVIEPS